MLLRIAILVGLRRRDQGSQHVRGSTVVVPAAIAPHIVVAGNGITMLEMGVGPTV